MLLELDSLDHISLADIMGLSPSILAKLAPDHAEFGRRTQHNGHYASRSFKVTDIVSSRTSICDFVLTLTYILSFTV